MELRHLRYAVLLAEHGHFGRAAQQAHITQSAFSQQIAQLERELGVRLFERGSRGTVPTHPGDRFVAEARDLIASIDALSDTMAQLSRGTIRLRVGVFGAGAAELGPLLFSALRRAFPSLELSFVELDMITQFRSLLTGEVDVAVLHPLMDDDAIALTPLFAEPRLAAMPREHPLADAEELSVRDLVDEPFVRARVGAPNAWRDFWACGDLWDAGSHIRAEMSSIGEGLNAVAHLGVVDTLPASATRSQRHPGVRFVPLRDASYSSVAVAARRGDERPAVTAFSAIAAATAAQYRDLVPGAVPVVAG